ncbi:hypothetical protein [Celerinatantimonas sp. YJH-8]|uniref:hypothetical protein n=1 Tax=Celerinatantimonas sp. YJH-8 TaxID=3228714 RepID=UPI0038C47345
MVINKSYRDRRKGPDRLQRSLMWLTLSCWFLFLLALIFFHYARPEMQYGLYKYRDINVRENWDKTYLPWYLGLLWFCLFVTVTDLVIRIKRNRRRSDHRNYNLLLLLLMLSGALGSYYVGLF